MKTLVEYINEGMRKDIPDNVKKAIESAMKNGYIEQHEHGKKVKYGISKENIHNIQDNEFDDAAFADLIDELEKSGVQWKYEKDEEWKKAGYKDPNSEDDDDRTGIMINGVFYPIDDEKALRDVLDKLGKK